MDLLCRHSTKDKPPGYYTTNRQHLPEDSSTYGEWNSERYQQWANRIGPNVSIIVERLFQQGPEQQYYRRVHSLLKLAGGSSNQRLDHACQLALEKTASPSYALVKKILEQNRTRPLPSESDMTQEQSFLRGADYYDKQDF